MKKIILILIVIFILFIISFLAYTAPIARSLKNCFDKVNTKQIPILQKIREDELTKEEAQQYHNMFLQEIDDCKLIATQETRKPQWVVELIFGISKQ